jgi:quercetin dioxygenase-like cupin family protein
MFARRSRVIPVLGAVVVAAPLLLTLAARAADDPTVPIPLGPGAELTPLSRTTTSDPVDIETSGASQIDFSRVSVAPNGTTGLSSYNGTVVVSVHRGVASTLSDGDGQCVRRTVSAGFAFVQPAGTASEIRNEGSQPLELYTTSLTPAGLTTSASASAASCMTTAPAGLTIKVLNRSTINSPLTAESKESTDVYVARIRLQPGAAFGGWHTHPGPLFLAVEDGQFTSRNAHNGQCQVADFSAKTGVMEPPDMVHEARNEGTLPATLYALVLAPSPQPFLTPSPPPAECESS